jgi:uncharacterized membrane protein
MMKTWILAVLVSLAACAPPSSRNESAGNDSTGSISPADYRAGTPAPDQVQAPKPLPLPEPAPTPRAAGKTDEAPYTARGQEPGWALTMVDGRIDYQGNYGEVRIRVAEPAAQSIANGRRYVTPRLTVEITYARCNDAMSGQGYEHKVKIVADGETYKGCGGKRRRDLDM